MALSRPVSICPRQPFSLTCFFFKSKLVTDNLHYLVSVLIAPDLTDSFGYRLLFVAVFLGCTRTGWVCLWFLRFYVQELPKAQPAVVLVLKRLRRWSNGLKSHPTDWEKPRIEPATPGLQDYTTAAYRFLPSLCATI